jgi:hypothetical protein
VHYETPANPTQWASQFDLFYPSVARGSTSATADVQRDSIRRSQLACNGTGGVGTNMLARFFLACELRPTGTPAPTAIATSTNTPTRTATATPTPSGTPNFTISVTPPSNTVGRPGSVQYSITLASLNGFGGNVSLSVSGLPPRTGGSFNTPVVTLPPGGTGSSILTITTNQAGLWGTFPLTVTGTADAFSRSQVVTLVITR